MAVIVYKRDADGALETQRVEPQHLESALSAGWSLTPDAAPIDPADTISEDADEQGLFDKPQDDDYTLEELRQMGVEAGIEGAETMYAKTLRRALDL